MVRAMNAQSLHCIGLRISNPAPIRLPDCSDSFVFAVQEFACHARP